MCCNRRVLSFLALALALSLPSAVRADDNIFTGTVCRPQFPGGFGGAASWTSLAFTFDGQVTNTNGSLDVNAICPLVKDNTTTSTAFNSARIDVKGNGNILTCVFNAVDNDSSSIMPISRSTTVVGLTSLSYTSLSGGAGWVLSVTCTIPRRHPTNGQATVKTIKISEP